MSDDGIGSYIAESLSDIKEIKLINAGIVPENYVGKIFKLKPKVLISIDATDFSSFPGDIRLFGKNEILSYSLSTHSFSPAMIINYMKNEIDFCFFLIGIQPKSIKLGTSISSEVLESGNKLINLISNFYILEC